MALEYYYKEIDGGTIKITLSYSGDTLTLIINNGALEAARESGEAQASHSGGMDNGAWPEAIKGIPAFDKGVHLETLPMGGNMYAITFQEVSEEDLKAYRKQLLDNGFSLQPDVDNEGYSKIEKDKAYSVGFILDGKTLQVICAIGDM